MQLVERDVNHTCSFIVAELLFCHIVFSVAASFNYLLFKMACIVNSVIVVNVTLIVVN